MSCVRCSARSSMLITPFRAVRYSMRRRQTSSSRLPVKTGGTTVAVGHACTATSGSRPTVRRRASITLDSRASDRPISLSKTSTSCRLRSSALPILSSTTSRRRTVCSGPGSISRSSTSSAIFLSQSATMTSRRIRWSRWSPVRFTTSSSRSSRSLCQC